ncbi:MAG: hypothetical protein QG607_450 [Patescibacteria group bacterium]|nr:hypothetical protein [Patescibacteria group bacterium]
MVLTGRSNLTPTHFEGKCSGIFLSCKFFRHSVHCSHKRASYSGYYGCLPSSRGGFDSPCPLQSKNPISGWDFYFGIACRGSRMGAKHGPSVRRSRTPRNYQGQFRLPRTMGKAHGDSLAYQLEKWVSFLLWNWYVRVERA